MRTLVIALAIVTGVMAMESSASAQTSLVASLGKAYGGDVQTSGRTWALALGGTGAHNIGSELEFTKTSELVDQSGLETKVYSLMASLMVAAPIGPIRPYGVFGYGFIRQRGEASTDGFLTGLSNNDVGYNLGAGVVYHFSRGAGVRVDLRHFKVRKADGLGFRRITVGIALGG